MSTNGAEIEDTEMAECEGEKVVTMMDVLQEQQEFEEDANAVLGASDDKNCTYSKGYIKRQAVYACLTCCNDVKHDPDKRAGVCLACSLTCHENHDLVELYTKRNFRCDCGNPKFNHPCQYTENKTTLNDENIYNQNFSGLYCTCHRPYPDPDGVEEEMIQCIICEDWLHASHLEATVPSSELYAEMICKACMDKNGFLHDYSKYAVNGDIDVVETSEVLDSSIHINGDTIKINGVDKIEDVDKVKTEEISVSNEMKEINNHTEATNTGHDNIDESKPDEQMQSNVTVSENTDTKNPLEENKADHTGSEKTADVNSIEDHTKVIVTDKTDDPNSSEDKKAKDTNEGETPTNDVSDSILGNNMDSAVSSIDQENVDEKNTKVDGTTDDTDVNSAEQNKQEINHANSLESNVNDGHGDQKMDGNPQEFIGNDANGDQNMDGNPQESNENDANGDQKIDGNPLESNGNDANGAQEIDGNPQESNENDASSGQNIDGHPQESNGNDADGDQKIDDNMDKDLTMESQEKLEDHADSTLMSDADKNIETPQVVDNHLEDEIKENKRKLSTEESTLDISAKKQKLSESDCLRPKGQKKMFKGATFWPCHFRQKLCTCNECITMYKDLSVLFLIDPEDTVTAYEVLGKEKTHGSASTQYEKGLEALSSLGRIQQINALTEYNKMRDKLLDFLKSFKDRKEVVKEEDIKAFFAGMKPKREPDGVYFCR